MKLHKLTRWAALLACVALGLSARAAETKPDATPSPAARESAASAPLPRVLLIGDSISMGYFPEVKKMLQGKADVRRPKGNCGDTSRGLAMLDRWLGGEKWAVIHFNFGLHDLKYLDEKGKYVTLDNGHQVASPAQYEQNLRQLVARLKKTGAKLIWCSTTPVPAGSPGRVQNDEQRYNKVAARVMAENGIPTDDLHAVAAAQQLTIQLPHNVHFTPKGYRELARAVSASLEKALGN